MKQLTAQQWRDTPYAGSDAKQPDAAITRLLDSYQIDERQWTEHRGPNSRPAMTLSFTTKGKTYRITVETLNAPQVEREKLVMQVKRAIYWTLKSLLESANIFGPEDNEGLERLLLPFLVDNTGMTTFDQLKPFLKDITPRSLIEAGQRMALPAPK